jgi:hypothetical protein
MGEWIRSSAEFVRNNNLPEGSEACESRYVPPSAGGKHLSEACASSVRKFSGIMKIGRH